MTIPGSGEVQLSRINRRTVVTGAMAHSPLKLLAPRSMQKSAWIFTSTYGGGLVAGDAIDVTVDAASGTTCLLGTQASTKVFPSNGQTGCSQTLHASIAEGATMMVMPDPVTCYAGSRYLQRQTVDLAHGASLVLLDWITSGRRARGERWAMGRYESRTDVTVGGRSVFADAVLLDQADGALAAPWRMGRVDCMAMVVLIGPAVHSESIRLMEWVSEQPLTKGPMLFSASPLSEGIVLRVAGPDTETIERWLRARLFFIPHLLDDDPWSRRGHLR